MFEAVAEKPGPYANTPLDLCGEPMRPDTTGALYWPRRSVLIIADLHFEKGVAMATQGTHLPPYDTPDTLSLIERAVARFAPDTVIALGDSFHRADSHEGLTAVTRNRIKSLTARLEWVWIAGNHDPNAPKDLGGRAVDEFQLAPFTFRHEPLPGPAPGEIAGHLHPAAKVSVRGRTMRRRCFAADGVRLVMPAMGAYAGGLNVLDPAFAVVFPGQDFRAWMIGHGEVHPIAARKLKADR
ncbi:FIG006285: ICC-like protein phosphoesterase [hydrothermal vent metagenome]|uniref:FIG006285: ICC-like protein phosphoesterase n=1 Tax=hydrothermal vent metagenome TaxID=652676 RepID=A0A3B0T7B5_9ZZZZ